MGRSHVVTSLFLVAPRPTYAAAPGPYNEHRKCLVHTYFLFGRWNWGEPVSVTKSNFR